MLVRILRRSRHSCCSPCAAAQRGSFPPAGLPLTEGARQMRWRLRQVLEARR